MKELTISDLTVGYMTSAKFPDRDSRTWDMLSNAGLYFMKFDGGVTTPYTIGVARGHLQALQSMPLPCLLLEDDARVVPDSHGLPRDLDANFPFHVPEGADAIYLGTSLHGRLNGYSMYQSVVGKKTSVEDLLAINNMLSMHAIVYLTERYKTHTIDLLQKHIASPSGGVDDPIADAMGKFNVYALRRPYFYQHDGHSDEATTTPIPVAAW
jgi:hypothetical protein